MGFILLLVLIVLLLGGLPRWGYSRNWGYAPSSVLGLVLVIVLADPARRVHPPRLLSRRSLTQPKLFPHSFGVYLWHACFLRFSDREPFTPASNSAVNVINGSPLSGVYWQVGSSRLWVQTPRSQEIFLRTRALPLIPGQTFCAGEPSRELVQ